MLGWQNMAGNVRANGASTIAAASTTLRLRRWLERCQVRVRRCVRPPPMNRAASTEFAWRSTTSGTRCRTGLTTDPARHFGLLARASGVRRGLSSYLPYFEYDPIAPRCQSRDARLTAEDGSRRRSFLPPRMAANGSRPGIYLPRMGKPRINCCAVPRLGCNRSAPFNGTMPAILNYVAPSGRIAVYPIYKSTHERSDSLRSDLRGSVDFLARPRGHLGKDFRRTLDYLSSRSDVDTARFAYFGSAGAVYIGGIIPAVEPRIRQPVVCRRPDDGAWTTGGGTDQPLAAHQESGVMRATQVHFSLSSETAQKPFTTSSARASERFGNCTREDMDVPRTELIKQSPVLTSTSSQ